MADSPPRTSGLETEYAMCFLPADSEVGADVPGNQRLFRALKESIEEIVATQPGERDDPFSQFFVENGGAFYYEFLPQAVDGGLLEGATPECAGPGELLLYQRAQETLLVRALPLAAEKLAADGYHGELGLLKNCRDAEGHTYGTQENYAARLVSGFGLALYRVVAALTVPPLMAMIVVVMISWLVLTLTLLLLLLAWSVVGWTAKLAGVVLPPRRAWRRAGEVIVGQVTRVLDAMASDRLTRTLIGLDFWFSGPLQVLITLPYTLTVRALGFRRQRRALTAFLASRCIWSGSGTLLEDGTFALSEKGVALKGMGRLAATPAARVMFDSSNLLKLPVFAATQLFRGGRQKLRRLFSAEQRLQIGLSDANRCQVAEYLKVGVTQVLVEMAERGLLDDAPQLRQPVHAVAALVRDASLTAAVALRDGGTASALDLQRFYLERARRFVASGEVGGRTGDEFRDLVDLYGEVLTALAKDPGSLIGRVDWVSKRYLIEAAGLDVGFFEHKKIDLKYHQLGEGYFDALEREGIAPVLVDFEEIERAIAEPPSPRTARRRAALIRSSRYQGRRVAVSWDSARIGGWFRGETIAWDADAEDD